MKTSRDFVYELIDRTTQTHESLLKVCLSYMSTDAISDMLQANEYLDFFTEEFLAEFNIKK